MADAPHSRQPIAGNLLPSREYYVWFQQIERNHQALLKKSKDSQRALATKMGSPDGSVEAIPERTVTIEGVNGIVADESAGKWTVSLQQIANHGGGTLRKVAVDLTGRVLGHSEATTTDLAEGENLYFTDERAAAAAPIQSLVAGDNVTISTADPRNPVISTTQGRDGQMRFTGHGPPGVIVGAQPLDTYLDLDTGDIYKLT